MKQSPHKHVRPYLAPGMVIALLSQYGKEAFIFRLDEHGNVKFGESSNKCHDSSFISSESVDHDHWFYGLGVENRKIVTVESMHIGDVKNSQLKRWKKLAHKRLGIK